MIKCIISDLGEVVLNVHFEKALKRLAENTGLSEKEVEEGLFGSGIKNAHDSGEFSAEDFFQKLSEKLGLDMNFEEFEQAWGDIFSENPEVVELLPKLKKNYKIVLLSNTDDIHINFVKRKFPIMDIFEDFFLSYQLKAAKPNAEIFRKALEKLNLKPEECVYIDDIKEYGEAAASVGIPVIHYQRGKLEEDLAKLGVKNG
ncbi:MAG: HAD family phosphatase [bacterium]|nr:HAD family phosphatase [bacterium]